MSHTNNHWGYLVDIVLLAPRQRGHLPSCSSLQWDSCSHRLASIRCLCCSANGVRINVTHQPHCGTTRLLATVLYLSHLLFISWIKSKRTADEIVANLLITFSLSSSCNEKFVTSTDLLSIIIIIITTLTCILNFLKINIDCFFIYEKKSLHRT